LHRWENPNLTNHVRGGRNSVSPSSRGDGRRYTTYFKFQPHSRPIRLSGYCPSILGRLVYAGRLTWIAAYVLLALVHGQTSGFLVSNQRSRYKRSLYLSGSPAPPLSIPRELKQLCPTIL
jgi:hypothetical protein